MKRLNCWMLTVPEVAARLRVTPQTVYNKLKKGVWHGVKVSAVKEWKRVTSCPYCGGEIIISEHYTFTMDRRITKAGISSKRAKKGTLGSMDCVTAFCLDCKHPFDGDEVTGDYDDTVWIKVKEDKP